MAIAPHPIQTTTATPRPEQTTALPIVPTLIAMATLPPLEATVIVQLPTQIATVIPRPEQTTV